MAETRYKFCGKPVTEEELSLIKEMAIEFWGISRTELAETLCELLEWKRPTGRLKGVECRQFLEELESLAVIRLPKPRQGKPKGARAKAGRSAKGEIDQSIKGTVKNLAGVILVKTETRIDRELWKELVDRYHYLGFKTLLDYDYESTYGTLSELAAAEVVTSFGRLDSAARPRDMDQEGDQDRLVAAIWPSGDASADLVLTGSAPQAKLLPELFPDINLPQHGAVIARSAEGVLLTGTTFLFNQQLEPAMSAAIPLQQRE